jgi:hypothetical protein
MKMEENEENLEEITEEEFVKLIDFSIEEANGKIKQYQNYILNRYKVLKRLNYDKINNRIKYYVDTENGSVLYKPIKKEKIGFKIEHS